MVEADIYWEGESGKEYGYWIHRIGTEMTKDPGNYIYAKKVEPDGWTALYIGHADNLQNLADVKEQEACAKRNGATHVHAHTTRKGEPARIAEQTDLVAKWDPPCNKA